MLQLGRKASEILHVSGEVFPLEIGKYFVPLYKAPARPLLKYSMSMLASHVQDGYALTGSVSENSSGDTGEKEEPISKKKN